MEAFDSKWKSQIWNYMRILPIRRIWHVLCDQIEWTEAGRFALGRVDTMFQEFRKLANKNGKTLTFHLGKRTFNSLDVRLEPFEPSDQLSMSNPPFIWSKNKNSHSRNWQRFWKVLTRTDQIAAQSLMISDLPDLHGKTFLDLAVAAVFFLCAFR